MFSQQLMNWIETGYTDALRVLQDEAGKGYLERVRKAVDCSQDKDEQLVMKYYFSAMPYSDLADTDFELLRAYARHSVFLRREISWCKEIPEKTFLMDVAAYRINNEKIMDCRNLFFEELWERVKGFSMKDAALEVNYWCAEHATYHLADSRTASALTVYRSGFGRCGEESVFAVTALRSIGIPARQVYAPLWAHCDDNHAWVEVWCDGEWYFLGACEPEEVLNKGWFTGPASRGMLLHAKYFTSLPLEEAEFTEGFVRYVNRISMYADSVSFMVEVTGEDGNPVEGAAVHFELLNAAVYGDIATKTTDQNGRVTIELGKGSVRVHAVKDGKWSEKTVMSTDGSVRISLGRVSDERDWMEYQLKAPDFSVHHPGIVSAEQKERNSARMEQANRMRIDRISSYYNETSAAPYPTLQKKLKESGANFDELIRFLKRDEDPYRVKLLEALTIKDMYDLDADVLEDALQARRYAEQFPEEIFVPYLLNQRVEHEELSSYRSFLDTYFTEKQKAAFAAEPELIMQYIRRHISYDESRDFEKLRISPKGALTLGLADPISQRILFCAICRTLGIPARINFMTREAAYYRDGHFIELRASEGADLSKASLLLEFQRDTEWHYFRNWTLSRLENGLFHPLGLFRKEIENDRMSLSLASGTYRLIAAVRMPSGDQLVREKTFVLEEGRHREIRVSKYEPKLSDLLIDKTISSVMAVSNDNRYCQVEAAAPQSRQMVLWLEPGKEPTQHVLNELMDNEVLCSKLGEQITVLLEKEDDKKEPLMAKVCRHLPQMSYLIPESWGQSEQIAQQLNLPASQYPVVYVRDKNGHIIYADCGYNVGSVDLMLRLMTE